MMRGRCTFILETKVITSYGSYIVWMTRMGYGIVVRERDAFLGKVGKVC
jgi:hypothetical protein